MGPFIIINMRFNLVLENSSKKKSFAKKPV
jgi:hypothetical protein